MKNKLIEMLHNRANYFANKHHRYEAVELKKAIEVIDRLVPPELFEKL